MRFLMRNFTINNMYLYYRIVKIKKNTVFNK